MVAVTYGVVRGATATAGKTERAQAAAPRGNWLVRFYHALIEARMRKARQELRMHAHLLPTLFDKHGNRIKDDSGDMPLGGW